MWRSAMHGGVEGVKGPPMRRRNRGGVTRPSRGAAGGEVPVEREGHPRGALSVSASKCLWDKCLIAFRRQGVARRAEDRDEIPRELRAGSTGYPQRQIYLVICPVLKAPSGVGQEWSPPAVTAVAPGG